MSDNFWNFLDGSMLARQSKMIQKRQPNKIHTYEQDALEATWFYVS